VNGRFSILNLAAVAEQPAGDGDDLLAAGAGVGRKGQFVVARTFGIRFRFALDKVNLRFARQHVGGQLADEQQNDAGVDELDADFF
jgi:hypothetical protein